MALGFLFMMSMEWFQYIMVNLEVGKIFAFVIKLLFHVQSYLDYLVLQIFLHASLNLEIFNEKNTAHI